MKEVKAHLAEIQKQTDLSNSGTFPFGWSYFPYGPTLPRPWSNSGTGVRGMPCGNVLLLCGAWFVGICLTAGLAGLGSPLWYDVLRKISELTRGGSSAPPPMAAAPSTVPASHVSPSAMMAVVLERDPSAPADPAATPTASTVTTNETNPPIG